MSSLSVLDRIKNIAARMTPGLRGSGFIFVNATGSQVIDDWRAQNISAVWAATSKIAGGIAGLPWHVRRLRGDGGSDVLRANPVDDILHLKPNPEMTAFPWRESMVQWALLHGNGYSEIERNNAGVPVALWPLNPTTVSPWRDAEGELFYRVYSSGLSAVDIPRANMFHLRGPGNGLMGYSVLQLAAQSFGLSLAAETQASNFFGNGSWPGGGIEFPGKLSEQQVKDYRKAWQAAHRGPERANRLAILDGGAKWVQIAVPPEGAQFLEMRQFQVREIARWFNIPPHIIGDLSDASFSNIEQQSIEFVRDTLTPWVIRLEQEANDKLLGGTQKSRALFTKIKINALMRGDSQARASFYQTMRDLGAFSVNDIREAEDMNPIGPDGDKRLVPVNMTTLEAIGEQQEQDPPKANPSHPIPPSAPPEDGSTDGAPTSTSEGKADNKLSPSQLKGFFALEAGRISKREAHRLSALRQRPERFSEKFDLFINEHICYIEEVLRASILAASEALNQKLDKDKLNQAIKALAASRANELRNSASAGVDFPIPPAEYMTDCVVDILSALASSSETKD